MFLFLFPSVHCLYYHSGTAMLARYDPYILHLSYFPIMDLELEKSVSMNFSNNIYDPIDNVLSYTSVNHQSSWKLKGCSITGLTMKR